jgi:hypothetical protein
VNYVGYERENDTLTTSFSKDEVNDSLQRLPKSGDVERPFEEAVREHCL